MNAYEIRDYLLDARDVAGAWAVAATLIVVALGAAG